MAPRPTASDLRGFVLCRHRAAVPPGALVVSWLYGAAPAPSHISDRLCGCQGLRKQQPLVSTPHGAEPVASLARPRAQIHHRPPSTHLPRRVFHVGTAPCLGGTVPVDMQIGGAGVKGTGSSNRCSNAPRGGACGLACEAKGAVERGPHPLRWWRGLTTHATTRTVGQTLAIIFPKNLFNAGS
jgi:hypothetical protein